MYASHSIAQSEVVFRRVRKITESYY